MGITSIDEYSSVEGLALFKDHQYELTSTYENTSDHDVDSMAVMYLYMHDKRFKKPDMSKRQAMPTGGESDPRRAALDVTPQPPGAGYT